MLANVDGGKRYLPGEWPTDPIPFFEKEGAVTVYDKQPRRTRRPTTRRGRGRPPPAEIQRAVRARPGRHVAQLATTCGLHRNGWCTSALVTSAGCGRAK